ncbi:MAG: hypothetical protein IJ532_03525 [Alphaproteobacteria bacterium]|nr:hypothetical protein [Alphaproteobacteria bacterium]
MENYKLKDYAISPDGSRVVSSFSSAERLLAKKGCKGKIELCRVIDRNQKQRLFWVCFKNNKAIATIPVFKEEENLKSGSSVAMRLCQGDELIYDDGVFYVTYRNAEKKIGLKMVQCFLSEEMVRQACSLRNRRVLSVELVKMYDYSTRKDISVCWQVTYFKDVVDSGFFFVDLRDGVVLEDYDFSETETYRVGIGDTFLAYNTYYTLRKDTNRGLYLVKSPIQLTLGGKYGVID